MSVTMVNGDVTKPQGDGIKIIAHIVNNFGIWGTTPKAGVVYHLNARWPHLRRRYQLWANGIDLEITPFELGSVLYVDADRQIMVANMVAQYGMRSANNPRPIRYDALYRALDNVARIAYGLGASVHIPYGTGLAEGDWPRIATTIVALFSEVPVTLYCLKRT